MRARQIIEAETDKPAPKPSTCKHCGGRSRLVRSPGAPGGHVELSDHKPSCPAVTGDDDDE